MIIRYTNFEKQNIVYIPTQALFRIAVETGEIEEQYNLGIVLYANGERIVIYDANYILEEEQLPFDVIETFLNKMVETILRDIFNSEKIVDIDRIKQVVSDQLYTSWKKKGYINENYSI